MKFSIEASQVVYPEFEKHCIIKALGLSLGVFPVNLVEDQYTCQLLNFVPWVDNYIISQIDVVKKSHDEGTSQSDLQLFKTPVMK